MASRVRAGIAYIDVRLGDLNRFWGQLKAGVEKAGQGATDTLRKQFAKLNTDKGMFDKLASGLRNAIGQGSESVSELRAKLIAAGKGGADSFLREFTPLLKQGLAQSSLDIRDQLSEAIDTGTLGTRYAQTFRAALIHAFDEIEPVIEEGSERIARGATAGESRIRAAFSRMLDSASAFGTRIGLLGFQLTQLGFISTAAFTAPIAAIGGLGAAVGINLAADLEVAQGAFEAMLGSAVRGQQMLQALRDFAAASPIFDVASVVDYARQLLGAGVAADKLIPSLAALSGIAAFYGLTQDQVSRAVVAFNQTLLKGKVFMEELRQVQEAGIPIFDLLAQAFGKTKQQITDMITEGKISADQFYDAIVRTGQSSKFLQALESRAKSLSGVWAQFKETLQSRLADALTPHLGTIKLALERLEPSLARILAASGPFFTRLIAGFVDLAAVVARVADWYARLSPRQQDLVAKLVLFTAVVGPLVVILGGLVTAFGAVASALSFLGSEVGLVIAAVAAVAAMFAAAYASSKPLREFLSVLAAKVRELWQSALLPMLQGIADKWRNHMQPALDEMRQVLEANVLPALRQWVDLFAQRVIPAAQRVGSVVKDVLGKAFEAIGWLISNLLVPAIKALTEWWRAHEAQLKPVIAVIVFLAEWFAKIAAVIVGVLVVAIVGVLLVAFTALIAVVVTLASVGSALYDWFGRLLKGIVELGGVVGGWFVDRWNDLIRFLKEIPWTIRSLFSALPQWFTTVGQDIVQGLINGVKAKFNEAVKYLESLARSIRNRFADILDIFSPSKVFEDFGRQIGAGLSLGIQRSQLSVERSALALAGVSAAGYTRPTLAPSAQPQPQIQVTALVRIGDGPIIDAVETVVAANQERFAAHVRAGERLLNRRG